MNKLTAEERKKISKKKYYQSEKGKAAKLRGRIKYEYGITMGEYNALMLKQGGVCAVCGAESLWKNKKVRLGVDHCHTTGKVRGLLCLNCNFALGSAQNNPELLRKMAAYLEKE